MQGIERGTRRKGGKVLKRKKNEKNVMKNREFIKENFAGSLC